MRIIKLSTDVFDNEAKVQSFFTKELPARPSGRFGIPSGWIAKDGLNVGEPLVFSYEGNVLYTAKASSGRRPNHDEERLEYPFCFDVDVKSIRPIKGMTLRELQERLERERERRGALQVEGGTPSRIQRRLTAYGFR